MFLKRYYLISFILITGGFNSFCKANEIWQNFTVEEKHSNYVVLSLKSFEIAINQVDVNGEKYHILNVSGYGLSDSAGEPMLPQTGIFWPSSQPNSLKISILEKEFEEYPEILVLPAPIYDSKQTENITPRFFKNPTVYSKNVYLPQNLAEKNGSHLQAGQYLTHIKISPVQYNPAQKILRVLKKLKLRIDYDSSPTNFKQSGFMGNEWTSKFKKTFLLSDQPQKSLRNREIQTPGDWYNPNLTYYKFHVTKENIYRLTLQDFQNANISIGSVNIDELKIYNKGVEIPLWITDSANGQFNQGTEVYFYADLNRGSDSYYDTYSDHNIFWLTNSPGQGKRYSEHIEQPQSSPTENFFWGTLHLEEDHIFHFTNRTTAIDEGEGWIWRYFFENDDQKIIFNLVSISTLRDSSILKYRFQGTTLDPANPDHHVQISLNGQIISDVFFDDKDELLTNISFNTNLLKLGENEIRIKLLGDTGAQINQIYLDWLEIVYPKPFIAHKNRMNFFIPNGASAAKTYELNAFHSENIIGLNPQKSKLFRPVLQKRSLYKVESAGFEDGKFVRFTIDDTSYFFKNRGYNFAVIDTAVNEVALHSFDVFSSQQIANQMADFINDIPPGHLILVGISDEGSFNMTEAAYQAFEDIGSTQIRSVGGRDSWAFLTKKNTSQSYTKENIAKVFSGTAVLYDTLFAQYASGYGATFSDTTSGYYLFSAKDIIPRISNLLKDENSALQNPNNGADYIIITHKNFYEAARELAEYRQTSDGYRTQIVDIQDIYDEFNFGFESPHAIKDFLKYAFYNWRPPSPTYVVLLGDASWDPKKQQDGSVKTNFIPAYGALVSDNWLVLMDGNDDIIPDMYIGRLPVESIEQARTMVDKIVQYESLEYSNWNKEMLFLNGGANTFEQNLFQIQAQTLQSNYIELHPFFGTVTNLNKTTVEQSITQKFIFMAADRIRDGLIWVNFIGHAGSSIWDVNIAGPEQWQNEGIFPFITGMSCHSARFANPFSNSLSEEYVLHPLGAIAYWGSSGFGYINQDYFLLDGLFKAVMVDTIRTIGEATTLAKTHLLLQTGDSERNRNVIDQYVLIGDPATKLKIPQKPELALKSNEVYLEKDFILSSDSSLTLTAQIHNYGLSPLDSFDIKIDTFDPLNNLVSSTSLIHEPIGILDSIITNWDIPNEPGLYKIRVAIDSENKIVEENKLNNVIEKKITVFSSDLTLIKPVEYGVNNNSETTFVSGNTNRVGREIKYYFEVDTSNSFDSPILQVSPTISHGSLITKWKTNLEVEGAVYNWRARTFDGNTHGPWAVGSFLFASNNDFSWSQKGKNQFFKNIFQNTEAIATESNLTLGQNLTLYYVESGGFLDDSRAFILWNGQLVNPNLRGQNVAIFDNTDGSFLSSKSFDTVISSPDADSLAVYINSQPEGRIVIAAIRDEGSFSMTEAAYLALESIGSQHTRQVEYRDSWAIIGRKGAPIGSVPEAWSPAGDGHVVLTDTLYRYAKTGTITSTEIGPALSWQTANFDFTSGNITESVAFNIIARSSASGKVDTLIRNFQETDVSLAGIDAKLYPKIQLQATLQSYDGLSTPQLKSWSVDYEPPPDLVVGNESILLNKDTVQTAEQLSLTIDSGNFGLSASDSFTIRISLAERGQAAQQAQLMRVPGIPIDAYASYHTILNTDNLRGRITLNVEIDAFNEIPEINETNNLTSAEFWVVDDTLSPDIRLTFDGREITQDEFVARSPRIIIEINDSGAVQFTDTSQVTLFLDSEKIPFGGAPGQAEFIPYNNPGDDELKATVIFTPTLTDGDHVLEIIAKDVSDNSKYISAEFIVSQDFALTHVMNYPNPFSRTTEFTYIMTQPANAVKIKIFTVAGRLIMILDNLPTRVGFNQFLWDGRDRDGDRIANGVYLYKVIAKQSSRQAEVIEKLVIMR